MAKVKALKAPRSIYCCQACGHTEAKWLGRCPACQEWNSLVEEVETIAPARASTAGIADGQAPISLADVSESFGGVRALSGIAELDRVLGGGLVAGSMVLLGGDPGVGKSTLLIQALSGLAEMKAGPDARGSGSGTGSGNGNGNGSGSVGTGNGRGVDVLYATGEESVAQTAMRARRVGAARDSISIVAETDVEKILMHAHALRPAVLAVDSIQTVYTPLLDSIPGSLAQVRECAARLMQFAKTTGTPTVVVGHVTKDGAIAGPRLNWVRRTGTRLT